MKLYFLILWLAGQEPVEMTFPSAAGCKTAHAAWTQIKLPVSRCQMRQSA